MHLIKALLYYTENANLFTIRTERWDTPEAHVIAVFSFNKKSHILDPGFTRWGPW